ncbi:MAG: TetR family transcriptional regulator, partial [Mycobacterium sp.]
MLRHRRVPASVPERRRAPYPVSPVIGPDGTRAWQEMVAAARVLFGERGYYATTVEAIAAATGRSDTAFYQYFQGKLEVFQIFVEELGADLADHFATMPVLEAEGLREFESWIEGLGHLLRRHSPVFADWPLHTEDQPATYNPSEDYMRQFADGMQAALTKADTGGLAPRVLATAIICLVEWAHIASDAAHAVTDPRGHESAMHATLARIIHRTVFPPGHQVAARPRGATRSVPPPELIAFLRPEAAPAGLRKPVTRRGRATVEHICAAALQAFERRGLAGTSVNDIIAEAQIGHGTFYQYWTGRDAVFATLAHRATGLMGDHFARLPGLDSPDDLGEWLDDWLSIVEAHGTVFHIWTAEIRQNPALWPVARSARMHLEQITDRLHERWPNAVPLDTRPVAIALWSLLTEFPYNAWVRHP